MLKKFIKEIKIPFIKGAKSKTYTYVLKKRDCYFREADTPFAELNSYYEVIDLLRKQNRNDLSRFTLNILGVFEIECENLLENKMLFKSNEKFNKYEYEYHYISYSVPLFLKNGLHQIKVSASPSLYSEYVSIECELINKNNKIIYSLSTELKLKYFDDNIPNMLEDIIYKMINIYYKEFIEHDISFKLLKYLLNCSVCDYVQYDFIKENDSYSA